jgi:hypothetical protein
MADDASHTHLHVSHRHRSPSPALRPRAPPRAAGGGGVWRPHILWLPWIYLFAVGLAAYIGASTVYARAGGYVAAAAAACGRAFPALPRPCMLLFTRAFLLVALLCSHTVLRACVGDVLHRHVIAALAAALAAFSGICMYVLSLGALSELSPAGLSWGGWPASPAATALSHAYSSVALAALAGFALAVPSGHSLDALTLNAGECSSRCCVLCMPACPPAALWGARCSQRACPASVGASIMPARLRFTLPLCLLCHRWPTPLRAQAGGVVPSLGRGRCVGGQQVLARGWRPPCCG